MHFYESALSYRGRLLLVGLDLPSIGRDCVVPAAREDLDHASCARGHGTGGPQRFQRGTQLPASRADVPLFVADPHFISQRTVDDFRFQATGVVRDAEGIRLDRDRDLGRYARRFAGVERVVGEFLYQDQRPQRHIVADQRPQSAFIEVFMRSWGLESYSPGVH